MEGSFETHGAVLKHRPVGDYDWIVTLLTAERGKINAFARAARRPGTRFAGNVEPLSFGTFELFAGKNSYTLTGAQIDRFFESFRTDLENAAYGTFFLELADYYARENLEAADLLNLLFVSLRALENGHVPKRLVRCIYELRAMMIEGEYPGADMLNLRIPAARRALAEIERAPANRLYTFTLSDDACRELEAGVVTLRNRFLDRKPKSLELLELYEAE